jgi:hypothetical protein
VGRRHQARDDRQGKCLANGRTQERDQPGASSPPWKKSQIQMAAKCHCSEESRQALTAFLRVAGESASSGSSNRGSDGPSASETAPSQPATEAEICFGNSRAAEREPMSTLAVPSFFWQYLPVEFTSGQRLFQRSHSSWITTEPGETKGYSKSGE